MGLLVNGKHGTGSHVVVVVVVGGTSARQPDLSLTSSDCPPEPSAAKRSLFFLFLSPFPLLFSVLFLSHTYCSCILQLFCGRYFTEVWNQKSIPSSQFQLIFVCLVSFLIYTNSSAFYSPVLFFSKLALRFCRMQEAWLCCQVKR